MLLRNLSRIVPRNGASRHLLRGGKHAVAFPPLASTVPLPSASSTTSLRMGLPRTLVSLLDESKWDIQRPKKGTGFDNFTPRDKPSSSSEENKDEADKQKEENKEAGSPKKEEDSNKDHSKDEKNRKDDHGRKDFNDPNRFENWIPAIVMLLITYYFTQRPGADEPPEGHSLDREISWHDFLRLLQQQDIVKVVVTDDRQSARVYVKSNAKGMVRTGSQRGFGGSASSSYEEQRRQRAATRDNSQEMEHDEFHEQEQEQLEGLESRVAVQNVVGGGGRQAHTPFFYRMHIGSVDAFERKLDEAQRALKRDPDNDVPVQYLPDSVSCEWQRFILCLWILRLFLTQCHLLLVFTLLLM